MEELRNKKNIIGPKTLMFLNKLNYLVKIPRLVQRSAQRQGQAREYAAQYTGHDQDKEDEEPGNGPFGAHPVFLGIIKVAAEHLRKLLF